MPLLPLLLSTKGRSWRFPTKEEVREGRISGALLRLCFPDHPESPISTDALSTLEKREGEGGRKDGRGKAD